MSRGRVEDESSRRLERMVAQPAAVARRRRLESRRAELATGGIDRFGTKSLSDH